MRKRLPFIAAFASLTLATASGLAQTQSTGGAPANGEIPVPRIAAPVGTLPGVKQ